MWLSTNQFLQKSTISIPGSQKMNTHMVQGSHRLVFLSLVIVFLLPYKCIYELIDILLYLEKYYSLVQHTLCAFVKWMEMLAKEIYLWTKYGI